MRAIGDFAQTNTVMQGMRTLGGASFEYYFATLNEEEERKKQLPKIKCNQVEVRISLARTHNILARPMIPD